MSIQQDRKKNDLACPFFQNDMVYDHPRSCAGVKADAMSDIRRHINRAHRPVFLKLCKTCNEDILSEAEYESYHGAHCKNVQQQRRGNSEAQKTQWNNLYRKLFPNESMLPGPCKYVFL